MEDGQEDDTTGDVAKVMGFGDFGTQPGTKRKLPDDAVVDLTAEDESHGGSRNVADTQSRFQGTTLSRTIDPRTTFTFTAPRLPGWNKLINRASSQPSPFASLSDNASLPAASAFGSFAAKNNLFTELRPAPGTTLDSSIVIDDDDDEDVTPAATRTLVPASRFVFKQNDSANPAQVSQFGFQAVQRSWVFGRNVRRHTGPPYKDMATRPIKRARFSALEGIRQRERPLEELDAIVEKAIGMKIQSRVLLREAFSDYKTLQKPSTIVGQKDDMVDNKMLALVGDRAIGLVLDQESWKLNLTNGQSARRTTRFLCNRYLAMLGVRHGFDKCISHKAVWDVATVVEAVFGAISIEHNNRYDVIHGAMVKIGILHDDDMVEL